MTRGIMLLAAAALMAAPATGWAADKKTKDKEASCPIERAEYVMRADTKVAAGFLEVGHGDAWSGDLALWIRAGKGPARWFTFETGTERMVSLIPLAGDPRHGKPKPVETEDGAMSGLHFFAQRKDLSFTGDDKPVAGEKAPAYLFVPELSEALWSAEPRQDAPISLFRFDRCR